VTPRQFAPLAPQWNPGRARTMAEARFVYRALAAGLPPGWYSQCHHLGHAVPGENRPASISARTAMRLRSAPES
jgi:hypothetical protein